MKKERKKEEKRVWRFLILVLFGTLLHIPIFLHNSLPTTHNIGWGPHSDLFIYVGSAYTWKGVNNLAHFSVYKYKFSNICYHTSLSLDDRD